MTVGDCCFGLAEGFITASYISTRPHPFSLVIWQAVPGTAPVGWGHRSGTVAQLAMAGAGATIVRPHELDRQQDSSRYILVAILEIHELYWIFINIGILVDGQ